MAKPRGQRKRRAAKLRGINAKEQVVHDRIADEDDFQNIRELDLGFGGNLAGKRVQRLADGGGHFLLAARIHHDVGDAAHQVFAETDLRVHDAGRSHDIADW